MSVMYNSAPKTCGTLSRLRVWPSVRKGPSWYKQAVSLTLTSDLLVSIPYSFIANRIGPIAVLFLNIIAFSLNCIYSILVLRVEDIMPTDAQLAAPFFLILGGNELIWAAASLTIANNLADNEVTKYITLPPERFRG